MGSQTSHTDGLAAGQFAGARVRNSQDLLQFIEDSFAPGRKAEVLAAMPEDVRDDLLHAARTAYWPIERDARHVDALIDFFGEEAARMLWRRYVSRFTQTPLIRAVFEGSTRLFGLSVGTLVRNVPRAWELSYRGCGECHCNVSSREAMVDFTDLHPEMARRPLGYFLLLDSMFRGLHDMVGAPPKFEFDARPMHRSLHATFRW